MYDKILVAIDDSESSDRAVVAARDLARLSGGRVRLVHVAERQVVVGKGGGAFEVEEPEEVSELFARETARFDGSDVKSDCSLRHAVLGRAAEEVLDAGREFEADLIIVGSHGRSAMGRALFGSVADHVVHHADRPVLVVR